MSQQECGVYKKGTDALNADPSRPVLNLLRVVLSHERGRSVLARVCSPVLRTVARERVGGEPDAPSQERPHGPEVWAPVSYVLPLETTRAGVQGVGVFESVSELDRGLGTSGKSTWGFAFVIHHEPRGPNGGWTYGGSYEEGESGGESNGASFGASSLRACRLPRPVPTVLYREVLGLLTSALRHESAHPSAAALC
jgi:hypothetical protein